jgi:aromatic ring-cleaving dioxygenase
MKTVDVIKGYHAHVYFDASTRETAERVRAQLAVHFDVTFGRWHEEPVGPHSKAMYQVELRPEHFGPVMSWLMLNRDGLSILVHPQTGDEIADHLENPLWLGAQVPLDVDFIRDYIAKHVAHA